MAHTGCDANDAHHNDVRVVQVLDQLDSCLEEAGIERAHLTEVLVSAHGHQSVSDFCCKNSHLTVLTMVTLS